MCLRVRRCVPEDPDTMVNTGCILFKELKHEAARQKFNDAVQVRARGRAMRPPPSRSL